MDTTELTYPVFEADQVLSSVDLNELFEYLDEQTRLTRANLIGIGIACGLEVALEPPGTVHLSRGCGVTSQGHLIVEPADLALTHVRSYTLPREYRPFMLPGSDPAQQISLWELFPDDDEPGAQPLDESDLTLEDKALVLFLELNDRRLRTCSPNNCDSRGGTVTATVRRLLLDADELDKILAKSPTPLAPNGSEADLAERLILPDIRMPRVDVPSTDRVGSAALLYCFQDVFRQNQLAKRTGDALTALYGAYRTVVADLFPNDPFQDFGNRFGFLDTEPATPAQVRFMQYYWDLFDDLVAAYDDVRWAGLELLCACCPPGDLFPQHLITGVLDPDRHDSADYRHRFVRSPALGGCVDRTHSVRALFRRLVALAGGFTESPPAKGVKATPSRWGDAPLSARAIPYYYDDELSAPPVFELWDPEKTARGRAGHNLGYRADDYPATPPAFVTDPLRFDLEPSNFLRIEGHLGKNVREVTKSLLTLKKSHRLPIEVVALRTGAFDENVDVDLTGEKCRFRDLETLYDTLKAALTCFLVKQVQYFYSLPMEKYAGTGDRAIVPTLPLLRTHAPAFVVEPGTLGEHIEEALTWEPGKRARVPFIGAGDPPSLRQVHALVASMSDLADGLPDDLRQLDFTELGNRYRVLVEVARSVDEHRRHGAFGDTRADERLAERLDDIVFRCRLDPFETITEEYRRRAEEVKAAIFLGHFLEHHPGIQHKAGAPLGGTFILVYHELPNDGASPEPLSTETDEPTDETPSGRVRIGLKDTLRLDDKDAESLGDALTRVQYKQALSTDPDMQILFQAVTGRVLVPRNPTPSSMGKVYEEAVADLPDGAVIADFFLPYQVCSSCPPIQYQLPAPCLYVTADKGCTNSHGYAEVTLTAKGACGPLSVRVDGEAFQELSGPLLLRTGTHSIVVRDAAGAASSPVTVSIPGPLAFGDSRTWVDTKTYRVVAELRGGTPPYDANNGTVAGCTFTSVDVPVDTQITVKVTDAAGCTVEATFDSEGGPCNLPCDGQAVRQGYRFWLPEPRPDMPVDRYRVELGRFVLMAPSGQKIDLSHQVAQIRYPKPTPITAAQFPGLVKNWLEGINTVVARAVGSAHWLRLEYEPAPRGATTGALFVDRLTCIGFEFDLRISFARGKPSHWCWRARRPHRQYVFSYTSGGTAILEPSTNSQTWIPPFAGTISNKCRPGEPPVPMFENPDLELELRRAGTAPGSVVLSVHASGEDKPVAFLWDVPDGIPSVAGGEKVAFRFAQAKPADKHVRVTAFTEKGCTVTLDKTVNIRAQRG